LFLAATMKAVAVLIVFAALFSLSYAITECQVAQLLRNAGFPSNVVPKMVCTAKYVRFLICQNWRPFIAYAHPPLRNLPSTAEPPTRTTTAPLTMVCSKSTLTGGALVTPSRSTTDATLPAKACSTALPPFNALRLSTLNKAWRPGYDLQPFPFPSKTLRLSPSLYHIMFSNMVSSSCSTDTATTKLLATPTRSAAKWLASWFSWMSIDSTL